MIINNRATATAGVEKVLAGRTGVGKFFLVSTSGTTGVGICCKYPKGQGLRVVFKCGKKNVFKIRDAPRNFSVKN